MPTSRRPSSGVPTRTNHPSASSASGTPVGALGIPLNGLRLVNLFNRRWQFHDTALSTKVDPDAFSYRESAGVPPPDPTATMAVRTSVHPNPLQPPENSRKRFYRLIPPYVRPIGTTDPTRESIASTAIELHERKPVYAPENLVAYLGGPHNTEKTDVPTG